jgi:hypothetical protein
VCSPPHPFIRLFHQLVEPALRAFSVAMLAILREVGRYRRLLSGIGSILALIGGVAGWAQTVHPTNHLARARAYLDAGRVDLAEEYARRATEANEANGEAYLLLGILRSRRGDGEGAVRALARARELRPDDTLAREHLSRALRTGFPTGVEEGLFQSLPGARTAGELVLRDERLEAVGSTRRWSVLVAEEKDAGSARDPKYRGSYGHVAFAYVLQPRPTRWFRVATVRFQSAADVKLARRVATLLGQLFWARREYWSTAPEFPRPLECTVWLARDGRAGGEEWNGEIYLYEVARARSAEEWAREVIHEYGHIALPGTPIYQAPEPKANGYLGERLLATWLWRNRASVWEGEVDLRRYVTRRADPLRRRFLAAGPNSPLRARRDAAGMDYYIGAVLSWEAACGPGLLRSALERAGGAGAESFLRGCQKAVEASAARGFEVPGDALLATTAAPGRAAVWLYLPAGRWWLELETSTSPAPEVRWDGRLLTMDAGPRARFTLRPASAGWHRLEVASERNVVRRLALVRVVTEAKSRSGRSGQHVAKMTEGLALQARDVHLRDPEVLGHLRLRELFEEAKLNDLALPPLQAADDLRERPSLLHLGDLRVLLAHAVGDDSRASLGARKLAIEGAGLVAAVDLHGLKETLLADGHHIRHLLDRWGAAELLFELSANASQRQA